MHKLGFLPYCSKPSQAANKVLHDDYYDDNLNSLNAAAAYALYGRILQQQQQFQPSPVQNIDFRHNDFNSSLNRSNQK